MTKTKFLVSVSRTNNGWKISADNPRYSMVDRTGVPDAELGDVLEAITYYAENDLGCYCDFYIE